MQMSGRTPANTDLSYTVGPKSHMCSQHLVELIEGDDSFRLAQKGENVLFFLFSIKVCNIKGYTSSN